MKDNNYIPIYSAKSSNVRLKDCVKDTMTVWNLSAGEIWKMSFAQKKKRRKHLASGDFYTDVKRMFGFMWKHRPKRKKDKPPLTKRIKNEMMREMK